MSKDNLFSLEGKTALITGAGSGLGQEIAKTLYEAGANLALAARRKEKLEETKSILDKKKSKVEIFSLDVTNESSIEDCLNDIDQKGRAIDPESGEPIGCKTKSRNQPINIYRGKSAKQLGIKISEGDGPFPISHLDHAIYIGRELQRAEQCLTTGKQYIQD